MVAAVEADMDINYEMKDVSERRLDPVRLPCLRPSTDPFSSNIRCGTRRWNSVSSGVSIRSKR